MYALVMAWWGWLLLAVGTFIAIAAIAFRLLRASRRGRRFMALPTRAKIRFGRLLLEDGKVPLVAKLALVLMVGYLALPFDLIPDFIPVIGQLDDAAVVLITIALLIIAIPRERFEAALVRVEAEAEARRIAKSIDAK